MLPDKITYRDNIYVREQEETTPLPGFRRRVLHDWERDDWVSNGSYVWRSNLPEVYRCGEAENHENHHFVQLTKEWQFFWFDIMSKVYFGKYHGELTKTQYAWLSSRWTAIGGNKRAFTNGHGTDVYRNYVADTNRDTKTLPAIATLVCGGHCFTEKRIVINSAGEEMLELPSFDGKASPPDVRTIDVKNDPRIFIAVNITNTKILTGGFAITPFPQLEVANGSKTDVPIIFVSYFPVYIRKKDTVEINSQKKVNPYNPSRNFFQRYPSINMQF